MISSVEIRFSGTGQKDTEKWKQIVATLIRIHPGEKVAAPQIQEAVTRVLALKQVVLVDCKTISQPDNSLKLIFQMKFLPRVQDIRIRGNFPVFEREIVNTMTIHTGDVFAAEKLPEQKEAITGFLRSRGFIQPRVQVSAKPDPDSGRYILFIDIKNGSYYSVDRFLITGNSTFFDLRLQMRLETWRASLLPGKMSRFRDKDLDADGKNLIDFYRKHGYLSVRVTPLVRKDPEYGRAMVELKITEGPFYNITFSGNHRFWDMTLREVAGQALQSKQGVLSLRRAARMIKKRYREAGYPDCRVTVTESDPTLGREGIRTIHFMIVEGALHLVREVVIQGQTAVSKAAIRDQIRTEPAGMITRGAFVRRILDEDIRAIKLLYLQKGFPDIRVTDDIQWQESKDPPRRYAAVRLHITEGKPQRVASIRFEGMPMMKRETMLSAIEMKPGEPFREYRIQRDENVLAMKISEMGYPHVKITAHYDRDPETGLVAVTYTIEPGPFVKNGEWVTVGNFRTKRKVFQQEISLEKDRPFSLLQMQASQRNIQRIKALQSARIQPVGLKEKADTVHFLVAVEEKKPYSVRTSVGWDTTRRLYAGARLSDLNLLGWNKEVWAGIEGSQIGGRGELGLVEPRLLGTRVSLTTNLFWEKREERNQTFGTENYGVLAGLEQKLPFHLAAHFSVGYERKEQYLRNGEDAAQTAAVEEAAYDPRGILTAGPSLVYDSVDSFIRPKQGIYSSMGFEISRGLENSLDNFTTYRYEFRTYRQFLDRVVVAMRGRIGHIVPSGAESVIPEDQLFYLGGLSSVRGYAENRLRVDSRGDAAGGRTAITGSVEIRLDVGWDLEISPFYDVGRLRNTVGTEDPDDWRSSIGMSLRYITTYCPIGIQYGVPLDRVGGRKEQGRFYLTIGYTF